jgi:phage-related protein
MSGLTQYDSLVLPTHKPLAMYFEKKTQQTPKRVIDACKRRLRDYDAD